MLNFQEPIKQPKEWKFEGKTLEEAEGKAQKFIDSAPNKENLAFHQSYEDLHSQEAYIILKEKVAT